MKERPIAFYAEIARELKSINSAIFYQQIRYWSDKGSRDDGWIYKTAKNIEKETTLTEDQQRICKKNLIKKGWIEAQKMMLNGSLVWHYRLLLDFSFSMHPTGIIPVATPKNPSSTTPKNPSSSITENTTENTAESLSKKIPDITTGKNYVPDHKPPKKKKREMTRTEKQIAAFNALRSITYFRKKADENEMEYFKEEDDALNSRFQKQAKDFEKRYRNNWKDVIDWWWAGEGDWANFHPSNFFGIGTYMKFDNKDKQKKKGGAYKI